MAKLVAVVVVPLVEVEEVVVVPHMDAPSASHAPIRYNNRLPARSTVSKCSTKLILYGQYLASMRVDCGVQWGLEQFCH
jgi:hypothetical protein